MKSNRSFTSSTRASINNLSLSSASAGFLELGLPSRRQVKKGRNPLMPSNVMPWWTLISNPRNCFQSIYLDIAYLVSSNCSMVLFSMRVCLVTIDTNWRMSAQLCLPMKDKFNRLASSLSLRTSGSKGGSWRMNTYFQQVKIECKMTFAATLVVHPHRSTTIPIPDLNLTWAMRLWEKRNQLQLPSNLYLV